MTDELWIQNNNLELSDYISKLSVEEFVQWVYKEYSVSLEEQAELEQAMLWPYLVKDL